MEGGLSTFSLLPPVKMISVWGLRWSGVSVHVLGSGGFGDRDCEAKFLDALGEILGQAFWITLFVIVGT